jgi:hypothetical protein
VAVLAGGTSLEELVEGFAIGTGVRRSRSGRSDRGRHRDRQLLLRDADDSLAGVLLAAGCGGMLYLTVTAPIPPSEARQYEGSGASRHRRRVPGDPAAHRHGMRPASRPIASGGVRWQSTF